MSMSKKIFAIILLLVAIAAAITSVSLYSIDALGDNITTLGGLANRSVNFNNMSQMQLRRQLNLQLILLENDEEVMKEHDGRIVELSREFDAEIESLKRNLPPNPSPIQAEAPVKIRELWDKYVTVTNDISRLGLENSNNRAVEIWEKSGPLWDKADQDLYALANKLRANSNPEIVDLNVVVRGLRTELAFFRNAMVNYITDPDRERGKRHEETFMAAVKNIDQTLGEIARDVPAADGGGDAETVVKALQNQGVATIGQIVPLVNSNSNGRAKAIFETTGAQAEKAFSDYIASLLKVSDASIIRETTNGAQLRRSITAFMLAVSIGGILLGVILSWITVRAIVRRLNAIIAGLGSASQEVLAASGQISDSSQSLAEGATEQAASLEETSSALEEMASMTRQNADNTNKTNDTTRHNNKLIGTGAEAVSNMTTAMSEINDSAEKISHIIKTIEDIAFQTNLLALNAAVEAARAGEAGKGFAVVADEVRNLAQRSAQAARDTTQLIQGTVENIRHGSGIANELNSSFGEIQQGSMEVGRLISEITSATNEQAQGVDQVNTAVAQMDKVTQQNAASAEESASAAEELTAQADSLNGMVSDLIALVEGRARQVGSAGAAGPVRRPAPRAGGKPKVLRVNEFSEPAHTGRPSSAARKADGVKMLPASEVIPLGEDDDF